MLQASKNLIVLTLLYNRLTIDSKSYCIAECQGHSKMITDFTSVSETQLMTSAADGTIRVWDWTTGRHVSTLVAHERAVRGLSLTSQRVISGGMDGCVRVWDRADMTTSYEMREKARAVWHLVSEADTIGLALLVEEGKHLIEMWDVSQLE